MRNWVRYRSSPAPSGPARNTATSYTAISTRSRLWMQSILSPAIPDDAWHLVEVQWENDPDVNGGAPMWYLNGGPAERPIRFVFKVLDELESSKESENVR